MSWDVILEKPLPGTKPGDFDEEALEMFDLDKVDSTLKQLCPNMIRTSPLGRIYDGPGYSIEFDLAEDIIMLYVRISTDDGDKNFMSLICEICTQLSCRALDTASVEFFV